MTLNSCHDQFPFRISLSLSLSPSPAHLSRADQAENGVDGNVGHVNRF